MYGALSIKQGSLSSNRGTYSKPVTSRALLALLVDKVVIFDMLEEKEMSGLMRCPWMFAMCGSASAGGR